MKTSIKIGRDNTNDIIINEPRVSRNHAVITLLETERYEVKDLGSSNGTFVNGKKIQNELLRPGDKLQIAHSLVDWESAFTKSGSSKLQTAIQENPFAAIRKTITVGSLGDNDIRIENDFVSGHHAKISVLQNNDYYLQDIGSSNGTFINGAKVIAKNFTRTDVVKIGRTDLPNDWFLHPRLQSHFYKEHKKTIWISLASVLLITALSLIYFNRCTWFGWDCNLQPTEMYTRYQHALVHIDHEYFYTIEVNGKKYYVGKNKFMISQTEANTSKDNILAYGRTSGTGCFIKSDGAILTSSAITNPWLNKTEQNNMLQEVIDSRTILKLNKNSQVIICGETAMLKWIQNKVINNQQNYTEAITSNVCTLTDSTPVLIRSIKKSLPLNATTATYDYDEKVKAPAHYSNEKYYGQLILPANNLMIKDTFYTATDSLEPGKINAIPLNKKLPDLTEGSPVFNLRGELMGIVTNGKVTLMKVFIKQLNH